MNRTHSSPAARRGARARALGAARAAGGGRHGNRLPRLRVPERTHRPHGVGAADLRLPGARRGQRRDPPHVRHRRAEAAVARPLVAGQIRSFFSMTEPEVPGSDPTTLRTRAVRDGDDWVIDGHKWFSSGAEGAAFGIVMAVTDPEAAPHARATQIIVPADTPGVDVVRPIAGHGARADAAGRRTARCGTRTFACRSTNTLGAEGAGFLIAQKRLGPGRIHHVMRWLGADAARVRPDVPLLAGARDVRRAARAQADRAELDRRQLRRDPGLPPDDARRCAQDRRRR